MYLVTTTTSTTTTTTSTGTTTANTTTTTTNLEPFLFLIFPRVSKAHFIPCIC
jgi:hypothetical protein